MNDHFLAAMLLALTVFAGNLSSVKAQGEAVEHKHAPAPAAEQKKPQSGGSVVAVLVDADAKAQKHAATVQVKVTGVKLVDPAQSKEKPVAGQAHLHYRVDDGPIIATTAPKLSFHDLKPGSHTISVQLAANDHSPLASAEPLTVKVP